MNTERPVEPLTVTALIGIYLCVVGGAFVVLGGYGIQRPARDSLGGFIELMLLLGGSAMAFVGGVLGVIAETRRTWLLAGLPLVLAAGFGIASNRPSPELDAHDYQDFVGRPYAALHAEIGSGFTEGWYDVVGADGGVAEGPESQARIIGYENMTVYLAPDDTIVRVVAGEDL